VRLASLLEYEVDPPPLINMRTDPKKLSNAKRGAGCTQGMRTNAPVKATEKLPEGRIKPHAQHLLSRFDRTRVRWLKDILNFAPFKQFKHSLFCR